MVQIIGAKSVWPFLGLSRKFRKITISFVMSVRLSVRPFFWMEQLGSQCTDFHEIL